MLYALDNDALEVNNYNKKTPSRALQSKDIILHWELALLLSVTVYFHFIVT